MKEKLRRNFTEILIGGVNFLMFFFLFASALRRRYFVNGNRVGAVLKMSGWDLCGAFSGVCGVAAFLQLLYCILLLVTLILTAVRLLQGFGVLKFDLSGKAEEFLGKLFKLDKKGKKVDLVKINRLLATVMGGLAIGVFFFVCITAGTLRTYSDGYGFKSGVGFAAFIQLFLSGGLAAVLLFFNEKLTSLIFGKETSVSDAAASGEEVQGDAAAEEEKADGEAPAAADADTEEKEENVEEDAEQAPLEEKSEVSIENSEKEERL